MTIAVKSKAIYRCTNCKKEGLIRDGYFSIDGGYCPCCFQKNYKQHTVSREKTKTSK
jgi:hypothetical protein